VGGGEALAKENEDMAPLRTDKRSYNRGSIVETLTTPHLLMLHERTFGPLDPVAKRRMIETARTHGWDRSWDVDRLAA